VYLSAGDALPGKHFHSAPAFTGAHSEAAKRRFLDRIKVMSVRVKGGTPVQGPSLCESCTQAHIVRGFRESELVVVCQATYPERRVTFAVRECSRYVSMTSHTLVEMQKIAWPLTPRNPRQAGFVAPSHDDDKDDSEIELVLDEEG
jgi:hypothetical protein